MTTARPALADTAADDGELVRSTVGGDRLAFAAIYDRYADRLYDFCVGMLGDRDAAADCVQDVFVTAASKLGQLHDSDRLGSWLYAIARNEALSRIRARRREQPSEYLPEKPSAEPGPELMVARSELADLITQACGGLSDRDRLVLELSYRRGLDGAELADALGVSHHNAHTLLGRMRDNIERSLGALLVCRGARSGQSGCPELAALVEHWDGHFTVLMRKRVARHIDGCAVCEEDRGRRVNPVALLGSVPVFLPAPTRLREYTLTAASGVLPSSAGLPGSADLSWWPPPVIDTGDLGDFGPVMEPRPGTALHPPAPKSPVPMPFLRTDSAPAHLGGHLRRMLLVALILLGIGGGFLLGSPLMYRMWPASISVPGRPPTPVRTTTPAESTPTSQTVPAAPPAPPPPPKTTTAAAAPITTPAASPPAPPSSNTTTPRPRTAAPAVTPRPNPPESTRDPAGGGSPTGTSMPPAPSIVTIPRARAPSRPNTTAVEIPATAPATPDPNPPGSTPDPPGGGSPTGTSPTPPPGNTCPPTLRCFPTNGANS